MNALLHVMFSSGKPSAILLRLIIYSALLVPLVIIFTQPIASLLLPLYRIVFELIARDYRILFLGFSVEGADTVIQLDVTLSHTITIADQLVFANPQGLASVTTMLGNIFHPLMIGLITAFTWPSYSLRALIWRIGILIFFLLIENVLDIPLLFAGELWGVFLDNLSPGRWSLLTAWANFLQGGGFFAAGLIVAIASIVVSDFAARTKDIA
jgi:hypothetical protein